MTDSTEPPPPETPGPSKAPLPESLAAQVAQHLLSALRSEDETSKEPGR